MNIRLVSSAEAEVMDAVRYYERHQPGLGAEFLDELETYLSLVATAPERPTLRHSGYRRVNLKRFPHYLAYTVEAGEVVVLAVAHAARKPDSWKAS